MSANLDLLAGPHEQWCHGETHGDCCGSDCDCGRDERRAVIADALDDAHGAGYREGLADAAAEIAR